jgi:serine/threonine protein kinase
LLLSEICSCPSDTAGSRPVTSGERKDQTAAQATCFPESPEVCATIKSRFDFVRKLEHDAGISTYLIRQKDDGSTCVVKLLRADPVKESQKIETFRKIGPQILALRHKNIVSVREQDVPLFGVAYLLTENVAGQVLSATLRQCGSVPPSETLALFVQLCAGLEVAHAQKILHGNLRPQKIEVTEDGIAKISDFGLSFLQPSLDQAPGDPAYMSPEQCLGDTMTAQSDIYSLGCLMYQVLTGAPPFTNASAIKVILQQVNESPKPIANATSDALTAALSAIINKCLQKQPQDRYGSAAALQADLTAAQQGKPPLAAPVADRGRAVATKEAVNSSGATGAAGSRTDRTGESRTRSIGAPHLVALFIGIAIGALITVLLMTGLAHH